MQIGNGTLQLSIFIVPATAIISSFGMHSIIAIQSLSIEGIHFTFRELCVSTPCGYLIGYVNICYQRKTTIGKRTHFL